MTLLTLREARSLSPLGTTLATEEGQLLYDRIAAVKGESLRLPRRTPEVLEMVQLYHLRQRQQRRLPHLAFFTERSAAQATDHVLAQWKMQQIPGDGPVLFLCSGAGSELAAFVALYPHRQAVAVDNDPQMIGHAAWNLPDTAQVSFLCADGATVLDHPDLPEQWDAVVFDPDRRPGAKRVVRLEEYLPTPLPLIPKLREHAGKLLLKVSPMLRDDHLQGLDVTWLAKGKDLHECLLTFGTSLPPAVVLEGGVAHVWPPVPQESFALLQPLLLSLSPTLLRSGRVGEVMAMTGAEQLHPSGSVLLVPQGALFPYALLPWVTCYPVITEYPYAPKLLRKHLASYPALVIKKRHFPLEPQAIRAQLKIPEGGSHVLFCTTRGGEVRVAFLCEAGMIRGTPFSPSHETMDHSP